MDIDDFLSSGFDRFTSGRGVDIFSFKYESLSVIPKARDNNTKEASPIISFDKIRNLQSQQILLGILKVHAHSVHDSSFQEPLTLLTTNQRNYLPSESSVNWIRRSLTEQRRLSPSPSDLALRQSNLPPISSVSSSRPFNSHPQRPSSLLHTLPPPIIPTVALTFHWTPVRSTKVLTEKRSISSLSSHRTKIGSDKPSVHQATILIFCQLFCYPYHSRSTLMRTTRILGHRKLLGHPPLQQNRRRLCCYSLVNF
ncbi:hypothetical protein PIB30_026909 [Stylosanthes scabra]|uniref:Uncharacterized protein n=1 Tax=Stylosanthes scabra TaxID=79078 RepID=A0ABU6W906_9FABA|nr:hypothetical protein [Stylosanthes scabra]